jgi:hypothetical protein
MSTLAEKLDKLQFEDQEYLDYFFQSPLHLTTAQRWARLEQLLTNLEFVEAKCITGMPYELPQDCDRALAHKAIPAVATLRKALALALPSMVARPEYAIQALYNRLLWLDDAHPEWDGRLMQVRRVLQSRGLWLGAEGPVPGAAKASLFSFPFSITSGIQSISLVSNTVGIGTFTGEVVMHRITTGEVIQELALDGKRLVGIAMSGDGHSLAYIDANGQIGLSGSAASQAGRKGERLLLNGAHGIVAVRCDDALVVWQPADGGTVVLSVGVPSPLIVLRGASGGGAVVCVAGRTTQTVGIASRSNEEWGYKEVRYDGPVVCDAEVDCDAGFILLICLDRCLRILRIATGELIASLFYEKLDDLDLRGAPDRCAFGKGALRGWALFSTRDGHVACWNWTLGFTQRLEDYAEGGEPRGLVQFECLESGELFLATVGRGMMLTKGAGGRPGRGPRTCARPGRGLSL